MAVGEESESSQEVEASTRLKAEAPQIVLVAHNGLRFDFPMLASECWRHRVFGEALERWLFADTLEVLRCLPADIPVKLLLVGDGPDQRRVRDLASRYELNDRVEFLGEIDEVESIVAAADVALFPSESESFGLSMLEAQACGVPVVATQVGGLPEVVLHGETGYLEQVGDSESMARRVQLLLSDEPLRQAMGLAGAARAREHFSLESSMRQHVALYERLVAESW